MNNTINWENLLEFVESLVKAVGKELLTNYKTVEGEIKYDGSLVTEADRQSDLLIKNLLKAEFPDHEILTEEGDDVIFQGHEWCWVVDPIDGTNNFARGVPIWGISLGLLFQGSPVFGYVDFPVLGKTFYGFDLISHGLKGPIGAFLNGTPITPRQAKPNKNELFYFCSRSLPAVRNFPCKPRILGSGVFDFVSVASGTCLGTIEATPKLWDIAGAYPIVHAAGAHWYFFRSNPFPLSIGKDYLSFSMPSLATANWDLQEQFLPFFKDLFSES